MKDAIKAIILVSSVVIGLTCLVVKCARAECLSLEQAALGGWRTMKTAPRDGRIVRLIDTSSRKTNVDLYYYGNSVPGYKDTGFWFIPELSYGTTSGQGQLDTNECLFWLPYKNKAYTDAAGNPRLFK